MEGCGAWTRNCSAPLLLGVDLHLTGSFAPKELTTVGFRFIQTSDLHLGSPMTASSLRLPEAKATIRRRELRQVLGDACRLTEDERADALLIPGDLFDDESVSADDLGFAIEQFGRMAHPVVIAPGNHDWFSSSSVYASESLSNRHGLSWPINVHIFRRQAWEALHLPGTCITGLAFETHVPLAERLLQAQLPARSDEINLLLFHGSRQAFLPSGKLLTMPFTDNELAQAGCDYAAIGHYHDFAAIEANGRVIGAYSGCPAGRGLDERGRKVVLKVEIDDARAVTLDQVQLDRRQVMSISVDCAGLLSNESICAAIDAAVTAAAYSPDDIVSVELRGAVPPGLTVLQPEGFLSDRFFYIHVDPSALRPAYDLNQYKSEGLQADTTEGRFVRRLLSQLLAAEAIGDELQATTVRRAIEYGLDAFRGDKIRPRGLD